MLNPAVYEINKIMLYHLNGEWDDVLCTTKTFLDYTKRLRLLKDLVVWNCTKERFGLGDHTSWDFFF